MESKLNAKRKEYYDTQTSIEKYRKSLEAARTPNLSTPTLDALQKILDEEFWSRDNMEERLKISLNEDEMVKALFEALEPYQKYFARDKFDALTICQVMDSNVMEYIVKLEQESPEEMLECVAWDTEFLTPITYKYIFTCLSKMPKTTDLKYRKEHNYFKLMCNEAADERIKKFGLQFQSADNLLGWTLEEMPQKGSSNNSAFSKIEWSGDQLTLAYLFRHLQMLDLIKSKNIYAMIAAHFTCDGKEVNHKSIKTSYLRSKLDDKPYDSLPAKAKQIKHIHTLLADLKELMKELK